jgi:hypothetical protein
MSVPQQSMPPVSQYAPKPTVAGPSASTSTPLASNVRCVVGIAYGSKGAAVLTFLLGAGCFDISTGHEPECVWSFSFYISIYDKLKRYDCNKYQHRRGCCCHLIHHGRGRRRPRHNGRGDSGLEG